MGEEGGGYRQWSSGLQAGYGSPLVHTLVGRARVVKRKLGYDGSVGNGERGADIREERGGRLITRGRGRGGEGRGGGGGGQGGRGSKCAKRRWISCNYACPMSATESACKRACGELTGVD